MRLGDFKLIEWFEDGKVELFNLRDDVGEKDDLAERMPDKKVELLKLLQDWRKSVDASMPTRNPDYDPSAPVGRKKRKSAVMGQ